MRTTTKTAPAFRTIFGTREGSNLEKITAVLYTQKNKAVKLGSVAKQVYGRDTAANRNKVKYSVRGLNLSIRTNRLPFKPVTYVGQGEETTVTLAAKR